MEEIVGGDSKAPHKRVRSSRTSRTSLRSKRHAKAIAKAKAKKQPKKEKPSINQNKTQSKDQPGLGLQADIKSAKEVFDSMSDEDFFSDSVQHIYFYDDVSEESVLELQNSLSEANKTTTFDNGISISPKPIVLHINSPGGDMGATMSMIALYTRSRTPICAMIDGMSASAATMLSTLAPYRVAASPHVLTLIHQYSTFVGGKQDSVEFAVTQEYKHGITQLKRVYLTRTHFKEAELDELMLHDWWLDTSYCLKRGVVDRVLNIQRKPDNKKGDGGISVKGFGVDDMTLKQLIRKTNWNSFTVNCGSELFLRSAAVRLDRMLQLRNDLKPVMYYCTSHCRMNNFDWVPISSRIRAFTVPVFALTDSVITLWQCIPTLFCVKRYMYEHAGLVIDMVNFKLPGARLSDIIRNTRQIQATLLSILKKRTELPASILGSIMDKRHILTAKDCLKYGVCDEIVPIGFNAG
jgi:ATP-dependent protease ClpP protease subunit